VLTSRTSGVLDTSARSRLSVSSRHVGDWLASDHATTVPLDLGLIGAFTAALVMQDVVMWVHVIFVLLVVAALLLSFRRFVIRMAIWMTAMVGLVSWGVVSLDTPSEEISELPLLALVLVLVYLVAQSRGRAVQETDRALAELDDRTRVEHEILQHQLEDAQRRELIGRASAGLAHDLRNVFVAIAGCADELATRHAIQLAGANRTVDGETSDCVDDLVVASERGMVIIDDLLWLGRRHELESCSVDLAVSLRQVEPLLRRLVRPGIVLRIDTPVQGELVRIDHVGLSQILMNLVVNASDAIEHTGHITLSTRRSISSGSADAMTSIVVTDDGSGFDSRALDRAFEPDFTTKDGSHGGYGLATVWRIVERCEGSIHIDSASGHGAVVSVRLPAAELDTNDDIAGTGVPTAADFASDVLLDSGR